MDASDTGIAGKLNQIEPSSDVQDESNITPTPKERLIACVSRSLSKQERKWAAHEKEALAVIWSLEKFRTYLYAASVAGSGRYISRVGRASRFLSLLRYLRYLVPLD